MTTSKKIQNLINVNIGLALILTVSMLYGLNVLSNDYEFGMSVTDYDAWRKANDTKPDSVKTIKKDSADIKKDSIKQAQNEAPADTNGMKVGQPKPEDIIKQTPIPTGKPKPQATAQAKQDTPKPSPNTQQQVVIIQKPAVAIPAITWTSGKKPPVNFFHVILFTFVAGALGGVLCNLRGIFKYSPNDREYLIKLIDAYHSRPFMSALAGFFTYFVANLLVANLSFQPIAQGVTFVGFVGSLGLAMIAGFGSFEFMERLKETARTLFGGSAPKTEQEVQAQLIKDLKEFHGLCKDGIISDEEFAGIKEKIMGKLKTPQDITQSLINLKSLESKKGDLPEK